jgi:hypothetical protein
MFTAHPERFQKPLAKRRNVNSQIAEVIDYSRRGNGRIVWGSVLNDFQRPQASALVPSGGEN